MDPLPSPSPSPSPSPPVCDNCGSQRALVYCAPDAARLCLPCDLHVHSSNALSSRHLRALLCDRCAARPAAARCPDARVNLCSACDGGGGGRRRKVNCYSGCPTLAEMTRILAAGDGGGPWMTSISEDGESAAADMDPWMAGAGGGVGELKKNATTMAYPPFKSTGICDDDGVFEGFNSGDLGFPMSNIDDLLGSTQPDYPFQDRDVDAFLMEKNFAVADSNGHIENAMEASSSVQQASTLDTTYSNTDQMLLSIQSNLSFSSANICPNMPLPLSSLSGESRVADYQDCGLSPMFLGSESPWEPNVEGNCPQARKEAKIRYNEKKKNRTFGKQIRYISRKARADTRKRDKGRFVKACEPSEHTIH